MRNKTIKIMLIVILIKIMLSSFYVVYGVNTDYIDENQKAEKGIGLAVIENEGSKIKSYIYLYYDEKGEVHKVQYILNQMWTDDKNTSTSSTGSTGGTSISSSTPNDYATELKKKKYILKTDADNYKAKKLGAKEYYNTEKEMEADKSEEATALYKKIEKEVGQEKTLYDYIEGSDVDLAPYTIDTIVFNHVPLFDVNVFSDTAGGKEIKKDSAVYIVRNLVAVWFVSFRNLSLVILTIIILYYGIRIAISTVASDKAMYKTALVGWVKSLILMIMVHMLIYVILEANETLVATFEEVNVKEGGIYSTIRTRAEEDPWRLAMPALLLYLTLLLMWLRFLWTYAKRLFTVLFLIILSPLVIAKYAAQSASGKGSQLVTNWLQKFSTAVFIQSVHAMIYVAFVRNAIKVALDDLHGFVIALFFLNFMLTADKIFADIFKFEFKPNDLKDMDDPFDPKKSLVGAYLTYNMTKRLIGTADEVAVRTGRAVKNTVYMGYLKATDAIDNINGGNSRESFENFINEKLNAIDDKIINQKFDEDGNPIPEGGIRGELNEFFTLRKMARKKGIDGASARRMLRLKKNSYKRKFKGNFKIIKDVGVGAVESILAIPVGVQNPAAGFGMFVGAPGKMFGSRNAYRRLRESEAKRDKGLNRVVKAYMITEHNQDFIEQELDKLSKEDRKLAIQEMKRVNEYNINTYYITNRIMQIMEQRNIQVIDDTNIKIIMDDLLSEMAGLTEADKIKITEAALHSIRQGIFESEVGRNNANEENEARERSDEEYSRRNRSHRENQNGRADSSQENNQNNDNDNDDAGTTEFNNEPGFEDDETRNEEDSGEDADETRDNSDRDEEDDREEDSRDSRENRENRDSRENRDTTVDNNREGSNQTENNSEGTNSADYGQYDSDGRTRVTYNWGEVAEAISDAIIDTTVDNRFEKIIRAMNNIKEANMSISNEENEDAAINGEVVNINRYIESLQ